MSTVRFCPEAPFTCGNSSAVEHRLAKAGVASSNLVSRSNFIWRHSQAVRQRSAKPLFPSSILGAASTIVTHAGVAEQADATDLKSVGWRQPYRFDSGPRHQLRLTFRLVFFSYIKFIGVIYTFVFILIVYIQHCIYWILIFCDNLI